MPFGRHKKNKSQLVFALPKTDLPQKRKRLKRFNWQPWFWGGFFILFLVGAVYLFLFSPVFKIEEIKISGNNLISSEQIQTAAENVLQTKILKIIPGDTLLVLINNQIKDNLFKLFPEIASVEVRMTQMNKLEISVTERKTAAIVCLVKPSLISSPGNEFSASPTPSLFPEATSTPAVQVKEILPESGQCFFVDEDGIAYRESPEMSGTILPTFYSQNADLSRLRAQAVSSLSIQFASDLKKGLREAEVDLIGFILNEEAGSELKSFTTEGWLIYFDTSRSALTQAKVLGALLKEEIKEKRATLEYVDLRVQNRVYYK